MICIINPGIIIYMGKCTLQWNESGFRPPLCTYRLNWARRTSWGWWDDWDDTVLQTQDSKFEPWRSEAEHATSRSRRLPAILTFTRGWGRNIFVSFKPPSPGTEPRTLAWKAAVLTTTLGPPPMYLAMHLLDIKTSTNNFWSWYSGSQSHTTRRGRASCSLWYAPVANVCDLLLFLDENRVIPDFRHFWKVTPPDEELFTVLYFPFDAFPMTWPRKVFTGLNSTGMMVTWLGTLANTRL